MDETENKGIWKIETEFKNAYTVYERNKKNQLEKKSQRIEKVRIEKVRIERKKRVYIDILLLPPKK